MANLDVFDQIIGLVKYLSSEKDSKDAARAMVRGASRANAISNVSLASRAKLNVCQFPVLASSTISVSTYQKVNEILEQLYAQYLKLVIINQLEVINLEKGDNKISVVAKVHQNDDAMSTNLDRARDNELRSSIFSSRFESSDAIKEIQNALPFLEVCNFSEYMLKKANDELLKEYSENFNLSNLNQNIVLKESSLSEDIKTKREYLIKLREEQKTLNERKLELKEKLNSDIILPGVNKNSLQKELETINNRLEFINSEIESVERIIKSINDKDAFERERKDADNADKKDFRKNFGSVTDFENSVIRKNNQLEPSILSFTMKYHTKGGSFEDTKIALAVKTITHLIQSDEMCFYVNETLTKNKKVFRAIQILTGEKEFSLRFLLHLDEAKRDAKADSTTAKWWRHLKDRRAASWLKAAKGGDPFIPNATLLMSYEDYETLKIMYKKDLIKDTKSAWKLTDLLFLMHLVIVNDVSNELMIFNKDSRNWETYTLNELQKEINTMNKMSNQRTLR